MVIDYENTNPGEILSYLKMKGDKELVNKMFQLHIYEISDGKLIIPKYPCIITKKDKSGEINPRKNDFPFFYQVFWYLLMELKDIGFALNELSLIFQKGEGHLFPNGTIVKLEK